MPPRGLRSHLHVTFVNTCVSGLTPCFDVQMGAVIGLGIVAPIAVFRHRAAGLTLQAQLPRIMLALRNSAGVGTAAVCATITMFKAAHPHVFVTLRGAISPISIPVGAHLRSAALPDDDGAAPMCGH